MLPLLLLLGALSGIHAQLVTIPIDDKDTGEVRFDMSRLMKKDGEYRLNDPQKYSKSMRTKLGPTTISPLHSHRICFLFLNSQTRLQKHTTGTTSSTSVPTLKALKT